ncbi:MAG: AarF/ABC1/UbiB kinase family protein [Victivallales bacterium]|nr:AarF/ABC1/UbiB kinase family protein [Victivallales bacterium]
MPSGITTIRNISRTYRHIGRYRKIVGILLKNGFGFLFKDLKVFSLLGFSKKEIDSSTEEARPLAEYAPRLRTTLVELGPTYVKLGQILSTRPDILPAELVNELALLRDHVPPFPFEQVRQIIREELHGEMEEFFSSFDEQPVGAASIAQGHHAVLKDGSEVFVKVQRPGIRGDIMVDLEIMQFLASQIEENEPALAFMKPTKIIEEFAESLERELDFHNEMTNMLSFAKQFADNEGIVIPKPRRELSSRRLLVMDYIRGFRGDDLEGMRKAGIDLKAVAELGVKILLEQFFEYGFFHADPHPGNMFVLPGPKICYVDFGVMGRLTEDERDYFAQILTDMVSGNNKAVAKAVLKITTSDAQPSLEVLEREVASLIDCHLKGNVKELNVVQAIQDFYGVCYKQKLCLKPHIYQMMKALGYADAMGREMAPDFEIFKQIQPFVISQAFKRVNPIHKGKQMLEILLDWSEAMQKLPSQGQELWERLMSGRIAFEHEIKNLQSLNNILNQSINRLCAGIVLSGMIVSSAIVLHASIPPLFYNVSVIGLLGFLLSAILGAILLYSIFISGDK